MSKKNSGLTLLELLIAMSILAIIVLGFASIDIFANRQVLSSNKRIKLQNDMSLILGYMTKDLKRAIGNTAISGQEPITIDSAGTRIYVDAGSTSDEAPGNGIRGDQRDHYVCYNLDGASHGLRYYRNYSTSPPGSYEVLSNKIAYFLTSLTSGNNTLSVEIRARWDPSSSVTVDNPEISMKNIVNMPSVSSH